MLTAQLEEQLRLLDLELAQLRFTASPPQAQATTWLRRRAAMISETPPALRKLVDRRLNRLGVHWGLLAGVRITGEHPALGSMH